MKLSKKMALSSGLVAGGSGTLRVAITVSGQAMPTFDVAGVDAPASQAEFCSDRTSDPVFTDIGATGGGTLTVTSCSYSGNVGTVDATLSLTGQNIAPPYAMTFTFLQTQGDGPIDGFPRSAASGPVRARLSLPIAALEDAQGLVQGLRAYAREGPQTINNRSAVRR